MKKWIKRIGIGLLTFLIVGFGAFIIYTQDYAKATPQALSAFESSVKQSSSVHAFLAQNATVGVIFYPGGKVESKAYSTLCLDLSQRGFSVFLVDMPFNLAVFDIDAADRVRQLNPQIKTWFIAGHSLGGAMAYSHFEKKDELYAGIILLAAYPLSETKQPVLILNGSQDQVLDQSKLDGFDVTTIQGGNHGQFGDYGKQNGDGIATISATQQRAITVQAIDEFILDQRKP